MIFDDRYEVFLADSPESKALHYRLRYAVYCEETGWESTARTARAKLECDPHDKVSHHFLVRDRTSLAWIGGLRLIEQPFEELPVSKFCRLDEASFERGGPGSCVEVSRLFVLPDFRCGGRRYTDISQAPGTLGYYEIMLGLIRAAREFGLKQGVGQWYFMVEPALARIINRIGIDLYRCGPGIQHRGLRYPYHGRVIDCFERVFSGRNDLGGMFLKKNTFSYCSWLEGAELQPRKLAALIPETLDELAIA